MEHGGIPMEVDLIRLKHNLEEVILLDEELIFPTELVHESGMLDLKSVKINGSIGKDTMDAFYLECKVSGVMILPCSVTLNPVEHIFSFELDGRLDKILEEMDENAKKIENTIDILPIIWENILMEIPMKVTSDEAKNLHLEGEGWRLVTDERE